MSDNKDYSISCARLIALCFIVSCHFMQKQGLRSQFGVYEIEWAFCFNVGVQMFLFISGLLFGMKRIVNVLSFYKSRLLRILVDYYLFVLIAITLLYLFSPGSINSSGVVDLLTLSGTVPGLEHLWFIPTILFCYLITPLILKLLSLFEKLGDWLCCLTSLILLVIIYFLISRFIFVFSPAWVLCYVIGLIYGRVISKPYLKTLFLIIMSFLCMFTIVVQFISINLPREDNTYMGIVQFGHVFMGIVIVLMIRLLINQCKLNKKVTICLGLSDKYSYDIYLTHHLFVLGQFSCDDYIRSLWIAIPLAIIITLVFSWVLCNISTIIRDKCLSLFEQ